MKSTELAASSLTRIVGAGSLSTSGCASTVSSITLCAFSIELS